MRLLIRTPVLAVFAALLAHSQSGPIVSHPAHQDVSRDLFSIALEAKEEDHGNSQKQIHRHGKVKDDRLRERNASRMATYTAPLSPTTVQTSTADSPYFSATPGANFEGLGTGFAGYTITGAPPDTTMAVGPTRIIQWVNSHYAVFDKAGNALLPPHGFIAGNSLWSGFGGVCQTTNRGDPVVQYDHLADRWVFSQFAFNVNGAGDPIAPFTQCFAVSTTNNPLGTYNRYSYVFANFNDYGKLGVWPDAYYMSYNMFSEPSGTNTGVAPCAYDRAAMLTGAAATSVCMATNFYGGGGSLLPSDWDGTTPPAAGAPNIFVRQGTGAPAGLRMLKFHVDFVTPANSTFNDGLGGALGTLINLPVTLTRACNGTGGTCIPQPGGGELLDTLGDRLMYRLQYRKRGTTESLVVTQSEDPDGAGAVGAALRWYEIRDPFGATPSLFQNATFVPDSVNRWMGSVAMDKVGNMLIGYSASDATAVFPSIRITGRQRSEIRNQLQVESTIVAGTGAQLSTFNRWGDYSTMQVDPSDDCTFWYTTEYYAASAAFNWRTRIASFKFPNCQ
ncbi:MAG: hypothetical protein EXQ47_05125 [Bryobacterales bacterium]|nr:hypothetical protein [Bryobacterales bacterium]